MAEKRKSKNHGVPPGSTFQLHRRDDGPLDIYRDLLAEAKPQVAAVRAEVLAARQRLNTAWSLVVGACRRDPRFLDRCVKELAMLRNARGRGRKAHPLRIELVASQLSFLRSMGLFPGRITSQQIVDWIAKIFHVGQTQARRIYDAARKRK